MAHDFAVILLSCDLNLSDLRHALSLLALCVNQSVDSGVVELDLLSSSGMGLGRALVSPGNLVVNLGQISLLLLITLVILLLRDLESVLIPQHCLLFLRLDYLHHLFE